MGLILLFGPGPAGPGPGPGPTETAVVTVEAAFGSYPGDATYTWTDITDYCRGLDYARGRQNDLNRVDAGQGRVILRDETRVFDPDYAASPFYPDVVPMVPIRAYATVNGNIYHLFQHYVERWPRKRHGPNYAERTLSTVDGFELLNNATLDPAQATLVTTFGGNKDLEFRARQPGTAGNQIAVQYLPYARDPGVALLVTVVGTTIQIYCPSSTAAQVRVAVKANSTATGLVDCEFPLGSSGAGTVPAMAPTNLTGGAAGTFVAETTGTRIQHCLDAMGWPTVLRLIWNGKSTVAAYTFPDGGASVLGHIQDVAGDSGEQGFLFINAQGWVTFLDRHSQFTTPRNTSDATYVDTNIGAGEFRYVDLENSYDKDLIFNKWSGSREGGVTLYADDAASIAKYLPRKHADINSLLTLDTDLQALLQWGVARFKDPMARIESITVMPGNSTAAWEAILGHDLGDRITVREQPPGGGSAVERDYLIQHISVGFREGPAVSAQFTFQLWPADVSNWLILDDPVYGRLDFNRLAA